MNKSQSKYYNTACLMDQALLILLDKKDFDYITVKELCEKAGVNRSTFYLHYESMNDLLIESIELLFAQLQKKYENLINDKDIQQSSLEDLMYFRPKYSIPYLEFIKDNKKAFMAAVKDPNLFRVNKMFNEIFQKCFEPIQTRFNIPKEERIYMMRFYLSGIHAIIIEWIKNDCKDDINFIANLIEKCINARDTYDH